MAIVLKLDVMLALRKMSSLELSERIGLTPTMLSRIKKGKVKGVRFDTLELMCRALDCKPGDLLDITDEEQVSDDEIENR